MVNLFLKMSNTNQDELISLLKQKIGLLEENISDYKKIIEKDEEIIGILKNKDSISEKIIKTQDEVINEYKIQVEKMGKVIDLSEGIIEKQNQIAEYEKAIKNLNDINNISLN